MTGQKSYLDTVLLNFSETEHWTIRDAVRGIQIFGAIGSGKTSGSGEFIARKYLKAGFGGLVLCAKPEEAGDWKKLAAQCGLPQTDVIVFNEGSPHRFNPLQYELTREGRGAGLTYNLTELFMSVFKMGQKLSGSDAGEKDQFWENALKRCINRLIDILKLAEEEVSVFNMVRLLGAAPNDFTAKEKLIAKNEKEIMEWMTTDYCIHCLVTGCENAMTANQKRDYQLAYDFFLRDFPRLDAEVRSTIQEMFLGYAEPFLSGVLDDHFAKDTNITPEETFKGKLIILDFPIKNYLVSGIYAQCLFKHLWQQAIERRKVDEHTKPVFLWIDESHYFINEYDTIFQTTARSSRACTVLLTQNINNYYAQMGGKSAKEKVNSLLGNLSTMIFHANADAETNEYTSRLIGQDYKKLETGGSSETAFSMKDTKSQGFHTTLSPQILPKEFVTLKSGGEVYNYIVEGILVVTGRKWKDKKGIERNFKEVSFAQNIK